MISICEKFGWDYYTFISQPKFYIDTLDSYNRALIDFNLQQNGRGDNNNAKSGRPG